MAGYGPGSPGGSRRITLGEMQDAISLDPRLIATIEKMDRNFEIIMERLAILDDPSPKRLARHKMLKEVYIKYLFIEKLCMEEEIKDNES